MNYLKFQNHPAGVTAVSTTVPPAGHYALHTEIPDSTPYLLSSQNRSDIQKILGFSNLITIRQTHSDKIITVNEPVTDTNWDTINGDGLITTSKNLLLGILTADCVPVIFSHPNGVIGIVHAGWRGTAAGIHTKLLNTLINDYSLQKYQIHISIAPHIRNCCYEVGKDLCNVFQSDNFSSINGQLFLSLEKAIITDFIKSGIDRNQIETVPDCTACSNDFFSYRKGNEKERNLTVIGLK